MADRLNPGQVLRVDEAITSSDGDYRLLMQGDGNLVLYGPGRPMWATGTSGQVMYAGMQDDGNFVLYAPGTVPIWASNTAGHPGAHLLVQNDGNLVIYGPSGPIWATNTTRPNPQVSKPLLGQTESVLIDIVTVSVSYPNSKSGTETWGPPSGLTIVSYQAVEKSKYGRCHYSFSVIPDNSLFLDDQSVIARFQRVEEYVRNRNKDEYKDRIEQLKSDALRISRLTASTHSRLITNWSCKHDGNEIDRKGGGLSLAANVTLMRGLMATNIDAMVDFIIDAIKAGVRPQDIKVTG